MSVARADALVRELARSLPAALDDEALAALALRLRPFLAAQPTLADISDGGLLSAGEAARAAGVHAETIRRAVRTGELAVAGRVGRSPRIAPQELRRWLTRSETTGARIRRMTHRPHSSSFLDEHSLLVSFRSEDAERP